MNGFGNDVPPEKEQVIIYFLSNNADEVMAEAFYKHFQDRQWKNQRKKLMANWKSAAWGWILKFKHIQSNDKQIQF